jgi:serine/threonine-protein kinase
MGTGPQPPKAPEPLTAIKIGDVVLDRYRVVEQIASGGHSVVFRGQDERLSRPVCIKVFSGLGGKSGLGRTSYEHFVQEAFALSRLTHPNTLRIYDFGHLGTKDQEGMPLQVCEYMNSGTLSQVVREQGRQSVAETAKLVSAMCAALAEAHGLGIVHRDIKPQNILFGSVGTHKLPKLADFGIAKWSADSEDENDQRAEDTAIVAGQKLAMYSPSWAAPEQLAGQPVSGATDIYSLAVVAVYMLSGKAIFADEDVYAGYKKRRQADELVREALRPLGVSKMVIELLSKALAFDPKKRLANVDELALELQTALEAETEEIAKISPFSQELPVPPTPTPSDTGLTDPIVVPPVRPPTRAPTEPPQRHQPLPVVRPPWMATVQPAVGPPRLLPLSDTPQSAGERNVHFLMVGSNDQVDLSGSQRMRVRVTLLQSPNGLVIHLKGLTCFVAHLGGRPSPAVQIDHPSDIALVTPRAQEVGHIRVTNGTADAGHLVFPVGSELVSLRVDDCSDPILFDFGPGSDAYFVYTRGRTIPTSPRR